MLVQRSDPPGVSHAGLSHTTALDVKDNVHTLRLTFSDPQRVISRHRGTTKQLTGVLRIVLIRARASKRAQYQSTPSTGYQ